MTQKDRWDNSPYLRAFLAYILLRGLLFCEGRSKADLILVSKEDYVACLKKMSELEDNPEVLAGRERLKAVKPVWED